MVAVWKQHTVTVIDALCTMTIMDLAWLCALGLLQ